jgi:hypothetical protein
LCEKKIVLLYFVLPVTSTRRGGSGKYYSYSKY